MSHAPTEQTQTKLYGVLAEYASPGALVKAARKVRDAGYTKWDCHSPFPVHGLDPAMDIRMTILPLIVFGAGVAGCAGGLLLEWWTNVFHWAWIVSGKPFFSLPAMIPVMFECTVLLASLTTFLGVWALNRLPQVWHPLFQLDRFRRATDDSFFIAIESEDGIFERSRTEALLKELGALEVESCEYETSPAKRALPKGIIAFIVISGLLAIVPFAFIAKARLAKSRQPHYHVIPNMDFQPKFRAQKQGHSLPALFSDGRVDRVPPEGTVARGEARLDDHFYRGLVPTAGGSGAADEMSWATTFPASMEISQDAIDTGQRQFGIYCRPCHGDSGGGDGMINLRAVKVGAAQTGWNKPTNISDEPVIAQPHGQIFNTITHGIRTMPGYGSQITTADRWRIVLYVRALQRSRRTTPADVPESLRGSLR